MTPGARLAAAIELLDAILAGEPAGLVLTNWARRSRFAGSKDRAAIRDVVYDCLRRKRSLGFRAGEESGRGLVLAYSHADGADLDGLFDGEGYNPGAVTAAELQRLDEAQDPPDPVRLDYPDFLDAELRRSLGADFEAVMTAMASRAPVDLRVNRMKGSRMAAQSALLADEIVTVPLEGVETALRVVENARRVNGSRAYREGLVELQDASSQAVALGAGARAGMDVLDYCAGGGGKALALYDAIGGKGSVVAHDIAAVRMNDLPARAARAGARIRVAQPGDSALRPASFDLVFVDAPCSGTGSWRRTPDAKWRMGPADLEKLDRVQADILTRAVEFVRPGGRLAYATCSVLARENGDRIRALLAARPDLELRSEVLHTPVTLGDGFYLAEVERV